MTGSGATEPVGDAASACLQASRLLRRRSHRPSREGMGEEQVIVAVCGLLDALGRGYAQDPATLPAGVGHAVRRLTEQLHRAEQVGPSSRDVTG